ncbi:hypothetical protein CBR_g32489 [Chara braunii]|uniref:Uncharacterized protein n=1 Tax=Chara braunii TaxID=69332 RepID=A0A388LGP8_CHABU|nr:hypothetical protein CBR_g32489 [Chara braunii]|eukprot:GBG81500.1 hypothetical protein CBR_g32489 [Chara braunii]
MIANIQGAVDDDSQYHNNSLLPAPGAASASSHGASSSSTLNTLVPYQAPMNRRTGYSGGGHNGDNNGGYRGYQEFNGQRNQRSWGGGFHNYDRDARFDKIYGLLEEQAEEREQQKQELAKLELLEVEKKRLQAEEEKNARDRKEKELQESRLGKIVKTSMNVVCESVLGKMVDIPDDDEPDVCKLRRELEELKVQELEKVCAVLEDRGAERSSLKAENLNLKKDIQGKEASDKEAQMLTEHMVRMGAQLLTKPQGTIRRSSVRKTTPRNLRPVLNAMRINDEPSDGDGDPRELAKTKAVDDDEHNLEQEQLHRFQEECRKDHRQAKKADMLKHCEEEGITYTKLDQSRADVAEIRARRKFADWLKSRGIRDNDEED